MAQSKDMRLGPNTNLVYEFMHWLDQGDLLRFGGTCPSSNMILVFHFEEALAIAQGNSPGSVNWTSLRENNDALLYEIGLLDTPTWLPYKAEIFNLLFLVEEKVVGTLPEPYFCILDEVIADFDVFARCLAIHGRLDPFHETLWQAYMCGGWPCGCTGSEPVSTDYIWYPNDQQLFLEMKDRQFFVLWETNNSRQDENL